MENCIKHDSENLNKSIDLLFEILNKTSISYEDSQIILRSLRSYFHIFNRDQKFKKVERLLSNKFSEILDHCSSQDGIEMATLAYLFSYTLANDYKSVQNQIYNDVALPYKNWVLKNWNLDDLKFIKSGEKYVFICRHATTRGGYAPGSSIFTFCKALLNYNKEVILIVFGAIDDTFKNLDDTNKNLKVFLIEQSLSFEFKCKMLVNILRNFKPKLILTEIAFETPSILSILGVPIPMIFLSPGYYNLPWYHKIGLTDNLSKDPVGPRDDYFEIPTYVAPEILDPFVDPQDIIKAKESLGIIEEDFVIGAFARMEKFKKPFLQFVERLLKHNPNIKFIIAGPNNRELVFNELKPFIESKRVILLGRSNVHILAHCINIGIDTFPTHSGFSIMEIMAKGIPVVSKFDEQMISFGIENQRVKSLTLDNEDDLIILINTLYKDRVFFKKSSQECYDFVRSNDNDEKFYNAISQAEKSIHLE
ncbi:MAG: hypothetical protein CBB97_25735 [Candidatus Endolissoclinum sp. TMED37]|nr:MAG: hypothetical protein CBB97_25735 [Candidatus Endolissoclinum sp. TMED37]